MRVQTAASNSWHAVCGDETGNGARVLPCITAAAAAKSLQSCPTLWDPTDGSPPSMGFSRKSTGVGCHCLLRPRITSCAQMPRPYQVLLQRLTSKPKDHTGLLCAELPPGARWCPWQCHTVTHSPKNI